MSSARSQKKKEILPKTPQTLGPKYTKSKNVPLNPSLIRTCEAELPFSLFNTDTTESAGWETIAQNTPAERIISH